MIDKNLQKIYDIKKAQRLLEKYSLLEASYKKKLKVALDKIKIRKKKKWLG